MGGDSLLLFTPISDSQAPLLGGRKTFTLRLLRITAEQNNSTPSYFLEIVIRFAVESRIPSAPPLQLAIRASPLCYLLICHLYTVTGRLVLLGIDSQSGLGGGEDIRASPLLHPT